MNAKQIILDCDPGHDDAVAILVALGSPAIELMGISTVFGNCRVEDATRNARDVLHLVGRDDVPVVEGASESLRGERALGNYVHGESGLDGPVLHPAKVSPLDTDVVSWMAGLIAGSDTDTTIVATGPLTNVARLVQECPDVLESISEVVFMGGSTERGNHTPYAEFNTYADPEALRVVLQSGIRTRMVGLNLTHQACATPDVVERMRELNTRVADVVADWMGFFGQSYEEVWSFSSPPVHDPCTVVALVDPDIVSWKPSFVGVETQGELTRGATPVDLDMRWPEEVPNAQVAVHLDAARYWDVVLAALKSLGDVRS